jgi:hypothetical protein
MAFQMNVLASSKKTSCAFNTFIQSLPSAWSHPSILEGSKNHNSAETRQRPKFTSDEPLVQYDKIFEKLLLRTIQKYMQERNLLNESQFGF